ncbi:DUF7344 domain-containing protein [Halopiger xanaduensis]|uniref:DUF7344 domain-containing protein n=1 Tax=Halopiger xanaduensis (strain DSM 18323 / JCM 14033 / SH-6) TaxID=797210 RepID=F8D7A5_HALXS|nr:helix-turn-helix transcriptional regulator [Halopiger xanaduensis]AEH37822.1 hypothetical protein Halxa_3210 [Halopiger xanaduensis SH-6]
MNPREERVLRLIADPRNRAILTVLNDAAQPLTVSELLDRLVTAETEICDSVATEADRKRIRISLHHNRLPKLEEAGLVEYDRAANVVSYERYPAVDAEILELELIDELLSYFSTGSEISGDTIGVIEGRDAVVEYGHHLTDAADDELFLMYESDELLQSACLDHVDEALERDVDVALGSKNPAVLERTRDRLPGVTVWEPQLDWWNEPGTYPTVGRLVFADRERIMLAILKASDLDGTTTEMAIVGEGPENPLVVLVRQLLGPRLDHLDYQCEEFLDDLPFES